ARARYPARAAGPHGVVHGRRPASLAGGAGADARAVGNPRRPLSWGRWRIAPALILYFFFFFAAGRGLGGGGAGAGSASGSSRGAGESTVFSWPIAWRNSARRCW